MQDWLLRLSVSALRNLCEGGDRHTTDHLSSTGTRKLAKAFAGLDLTSVGKAASQPATKSPSAIQVGD